MWYGDVGNYPLLPNPNALVAISKCMWAVKLLLRNSPQLEVLAKLSWPV